MAGLLTWPIRVRGHVAWRRMPKNRICASYLYDFGTPNGCYFEGYMEAIRDRDGQEVGPQETRSGVLIGRMGCPASHATRQVMELTAEKRVDNGMRLFDELYGKGNWEHRAHS